MTASYLTSRQGRRRPGSARPDDPALEALVKEIQGLRKATRKSQLRRSSIDDGYLTLTTGGTVAAYVGTQYDGQTDVVPVNGPKPPIPSMPTLETVAGGVRVRWDGTYREPQPGFTEPIVAPTTFRSAEVHVSTTPDFDATGFDTMRGSILSPRGGDFTVPWSTAGVRLFARLVCRTSSGQGSDPSLTAGPVLSGAQVRYGSGTTIYYGTARPTPPGGGFLEGDLWLHDLGISTGAAGHPPAGTPESEVLRWDAAVSDWAETDLDIGASLGTAIATVLAVNSKAKIFTEAAEPTWEGAAGTAFWIDTAHDNRANVWNGSDFVLYQLGNGAIAPASLIASDVIATGTITADLLEAVLVVAGRLVAGPDASHDRAELDDDGLHIWRTLTAIGEGVVEVARFGVGGGAFLGLVDATGRTVAAISDVGGATLKALTTDTLVVAGTSYQTTVDGLSTGVVGRVSAATLANIVGVATPFGLVEVGCVLQKGRAYLITQHFTYVANIGAIGGAVRVGHTQGTDGNTTTEPARPSAATIGAGYSAADATWFFVVPYGGAYQSSDGSFVFVPTATTRYRFLLTGQVNGGDAGHYLTIINDATDVPIQLTVTDLGPAGVVSGAIQPGGASLVSTTPVSPPSVSQQYYVDLAVAGYASYRGNGTLRTDTTDVVQGWDPGGYNGDGHGYWWWNLPSITGTVDRVDFYVYDTHTYYNGGGTAIWNIIPAGGGPSFESSKLRGDWLVAGYPKVGGVTVTLPSDWWPFFRNASSPRAIGISAGDSGTTNETYYCRFDGPSARLRIWYTQ